MPAFDSTFIRAVMPADTVSVAAAVTSAVEVFDTAHLDGAITPVAEIAVKAEYADDEGCLYTYGAAISSAILLVVDRSFVVTFRATYMPAIE
jgi:hypothetical protein